MPQIRYVIHPCIADAAAVAEVQPLQAGKARQRLQVIRRKLNAAVVATGDVHSFRRQRFKIGAALYTAFLDVGGGQGKIGLVVKP